MTMYHETRAGNVGVCQAKEKPCPLSDEGMIHAESADAVFEKMAEKMATSIIPKRGESVATGQKSRKKASSSSDAKISLTNDVIGSFSGNSEILSANLDHDRVINGLNKMSEDDVSAMRVALNLGLSRVNGAIDSLDSKMNETRGNPEHYEHKAHDYNMNKLLSHRDVLQTSLDHANNLLSKPEDRIPLSSSDENFDKYGNWVERPKKVDTDTDMIKGLPNSYNSIVSSMSEIDDDDVETLSARISLAYKNQAKVAREAVREMNESNPLFNDVQKRAAANALNREGALGMSKAYLDSRASGKKRATLRALGVTGDISSSKAYAELVVGDLKVESDVSKASFRGKYDAADDEDKKALRDRVGAKADDAYTTWSNSREILKNPDNLSEAEYKSFGDEADKSMILGRELESFLETLK